jgi:hypothetical protein
MHYRDELPYLPQRHQAALALWLEHGVPPKAKGLLALLRGEPPAPPLGKREAAQLYAFLNRHAPEWAWGKRKRLDRWQQLGGFQIAPPAPRRGPPARDDECRA